MCWESVVDIDDYYSVVKTFICHQQKLSISLSRSLSVCERKDFDSLNIKTVKRKTVHICNYSATRLGIVHGWGRGCPYQA